MNTIIKRATTALALGAGLASTAFAGNVSVSTDIATSTTWTANNRYNLTQQIYVLPGATLTIEAGTVIASAPSANGSGSLAVTNGGQINILGTKFNPVIMTSTNDTKTWNRKGTTGVWREAANEWGNLTIMGDAYISEDATPGNVASPSASNVAAMEGLQNGPATDNYGGGNDDYDAGTIQYLSLRYGGRVIGLNNELNGLSIGGLGRETDIHHVEIMNNVDDGVEVWGGTVNLSHIAVWNVGDDSIDIDQGWRGKFQFGLVVQGYSLDASQGSGVGDNCIEIDGAENSDYQPVTTASMWNMTIIGQPVSGDGLTTWRDNARVQYNSCVFMDGGDQLVRFDNLDGDGGLGYGHNGTLSWADTWTTDYTETSTVNAPGDPSAFYTAQSSGKLAQITDSVFFRNLNASAYTEAFARGVFDLTTDNVLIPGFNNANAPVRNIERDAGSLKGGLFQLRVTRLDPRARNEAVTAVRSAPNDGFFTPVNYRGAFSPTSNWLCGWSASSQFGFVEGCTSIAGNYTPLLGPKL